MTLVSPLDELPPDVDSLGPSQVDQLQLIIGYQVVQRGAQDEVLVHRTVIVPHPAELHPVIMVAEPRPLLSPQLPAAVWQIPLSLQWPIVKRLELPLGLAFCEFAKTSAVGLEVAHENAWIVLNVRLRARLCRGAAA